MCGIYGGHRALLMPNVCDLLKHRGPDQHGEACFKDRNGGDFLVGMARLNIVDRRPMQVPFTSENATITYNGEVYNWREIRSELEKKGKRFTTETDTEVVLCAYLEWGPRCLEKLNGMFAFAIWQDGELFLARDRFGMNPLFYQVRGNQFAFASEVKAFRNLEPRTVDVCERLEFYFDAHTPFSNTTSLEPGEYLLVDTAALRVSRTRWWKYPEYSGTITDLKAGLAEFLPLFEDSCRIRKQADVPVTVFLSGGVDSSLIQAVLKLDTTYTVQFPELRETIDEETLVREFAEAFRFDARMVRPTPQDFDEVLSLLARHVEFPVGSFSIFPLFCLARAARNDGFVVALSGEGADEFFNGYYRNEILLEEESVVQRHASGPYRQLASKYFGSARERMARMASRGGEPDMPALLEAFGRHWDDAAPFAHNLSVVESGIFLQPLLLMADRMSQAHGLEVRTVFTDHRLVDFSARLAPELRFRNGRGKYFLREALKQLIGSDKLGVTRREVKHGLPSPVNQWLFGVRDFDRKRWNELMRHECEKQFGPGRTP